MKKIAPAVHELLMSVERKASHQSDTFICESCGVRMFLKVLGNTAKCPNCGGTMRRYGT